MMDPELPQRHPISRAKFFVNLADQCPVAERDDHEAFMEAAIVFCRALQLDIDLKGDHLDGRFEIPGTPEVNLGLNITVGLTFDQGSPDTRGMVIEIVGAGVEFIG